MQAVAALSDDQLQRMARKINRSGIVHLRPPAQQVEWFEHGLAKNANAAASPLDESGAASRRTLLFGASPQKKTLYSIRDVNNIVGLNSGLGEV